MWLIDTRDLSLHFFQNVHDIEYAILSHRWEEDEVEFEEFRNQTPTIRRKQGYGKIANCCREALENGLDWAWIDTCCIDKRSSAELQEAINSMFKWYEMARLCFVYLSDVDAYAYGYQQPRPGYNYCDEEGFKCLIENSQWFSRCWTLQELIAPRGKQLRFYDYQWYYLGHKHTFAQVLSEITNIPADILRGSFRETELPCAAAVMSWAAGRRATRVEDTAYSLLGLCDVNMPMLYGEGERAFIRLQEEILRCRNDHSIFAWTMDDGDFTLLAPSPDKFVPSNQVVRWEDRSEFLPRRPTKLTNDGISLEVDLLSVRPRLYLAQLSVIAIASDTVGRDWKSTVWIWVRRLDQGVRYVRIPTLSAGRSEWGRPIFDADMSRLPRGQVVRRKIRLVACTGKAARHNWIAEMTRKDAYGLKHGGDEATLIKRISLSGKVKRLTDGMAGFVLRQTGEMRTYPDRDFETICANTLPRQQLSIEVVPYSFCIHGLGLGGCREVRVIQIGFDFDFQPLFRLFFGPPTFSNCQVQHSLGERIASPDYTAVVETYLDGNNPHINLLARFSDSIGDVDGKTDSSSIWYFENLGDSTKGLGFSLERDVGNRIWKWDICHSDGGSN